MWINTNHTMGYVVPIILSQISDVLSRENHSIISLTSTGNVILIGTTIIEDTKNGFSFNVDEIKQIVKGEGKCFFLMNDYFTK